MKKFILLTICSVFIAAGCNSESTYSDSEYDYNEDNTFSREDAIYDYWDEIRDYVNGTETIEACSSSGCYDLDADISDGYIETIYFPNGGYLYFSAEIDDGGYASDSDYNGNYWDFTFDMDSDLVDEAVNEWASSNDYEIVH